MSTEEIKIVFSKLDALDERVRRIETRIAFGAGIVVAVQVLIGVFI